MDHESSSRSSPSSLVALEQNARAHPDNLDLQRRFGWELYTVDRLDEARQVLEKARERAPKDIEILYALGLSLKKAGVKKEALEAFSMMSEAVAENTRMTMLQNLGLRQVEMLKKTEAEQG